MYLAISESICLKMKVGNLFMTGSENDRKITEHISATRHHLSYNKMKLKRKQPIIWQSETRIKEWGWGE